VSSPYNSFELDTRINKYKGFCLIYIFYILCCLQLYYHVHLYTLDKHHKDHFHIDLLHLIDVDIESVNRTVDAINAMTEVLDNLKSKIPVEIDDMACKYI